MFQSIAENYEIIRFVEHGNRCRPAMDCVQGELLIYRIKRCPEAEKEEVLRWIKGLARQLEMFHRCRNGQCYRYVNPYSVLLTKDGNVALLDLEAESNAFVMKNMQKRAMRNHFVKPLVHVKETTRLFADFFGYGKTVRFIVANTILDRPLTFYEQRKLYRITEKCIGEDPKKVYQDFEQILREIPNSGRQNVGKKLRTGAIAAGVVLILVGSLMYQALAEREERARPAGKIEGEKQRETEQQSEGELQSETEQQSEAEEREAEQREAEERNQQQREWLANLDKQVSNVLGEQLSFQTTEGNQAVIQSGENLRREVLRCLAEAYVREKQNERAVEVLRELCMVEMDTDLLRETYLKRIDLEQAIGNSLAALESGREASGRFPESKDIQLSYLKTIYNCEIIKKEERKQEVENLLRKYPFLKETEIYLQLEETYALFAEEKQTEKTEEKTEETGEETIEEITEEITEEGKAETPAA